MPGLQNGFPAVKQPARPAWRLGPIRLDRYSDIVRRAVRRYKRETSDYNRAA
jgi:hypothetical protein